MEGGEMKAPAEHDTRELTPLDALLSPDQRRLAVALEPGPLPWPQSLQDNIAETARRIEAQAAQPWPADCGNCRRAMNLAPEADPRLDHLPAYRSGSDANRLLAILDELTERGDG
jgi:hypothetical protein